MQRSALSRALSQADFPDKYFAPLCAAVGLGVEGTTWDASYVSRWYLTPRSKGGISANVQDFATAITALESPTIVQIVLHRSARSWSEHRQNAIAKAKGGDDSSVVYVVSGGAVRRLLYTAPSVRQDLEAFAGASFERVSLSREHQENLGDIWNRLSLVHQPPALDQLLAEIRGTVKDKVHNGKNIRALRRVAELAGISVHELNKRIGL
jgi:hypothetical protein